LNPEPGTDQFRQNINPIPKNATNPLFARCGENLPDLLFLTEGGSSFQLLNSCHRKCGLRRLQKTLQ